MKRPLFVFAGQSNMIGAAVYPPSEQIYFANSTEYLHKPRRFGEKRGEFKNYGFPTGEFSYMSLTDAYGENPSPSAKSDLCDHNKSVFFGPSMCNLLSDEDKTVLPFSTFSEANNRVAVSVAPLIVAALEDKGFCCAYTHLAKGGVPITHFVEGDAADYFDRKVSDFFEEATERYADDDTSEKVLIWHQGESDAKRGYDHYKQHLFKFWDRAKSLGFTKFFMIRIGYFGTDSITDVMKAQEDFCNECADAFMITRVASFIPWISKKDEDWFVSPTEDELTFCRDSYYGFANNHINEKGFKVITKYATPNIIRVLFENQPPILEDEKILALLNEK